MTQGQPAGEPAMSRRSTDVSVCVPMYNGQDYLRECIDSILAQRHANFELLLVDDCSTDGTYAIAESYAASDSRVRVMRNAKNLGLVGNWNQCLDLARGEWIKFVFQDDTIYPECLATMLARGRAENAVFVACHRRLVYSADTVPRIRQWYENHRKLVDDLFGAHPRASAEYCQRLALHYFGLNVFGEPTAVLVHRSAFERIGRFNPALIMNCDFEMWNRIAVHFGALFVSDELATFRVHRGSTTASNKARIEFRSSVLDNLVILHQYVYDEVYEPVRRMAPSLSPPIDLRRILAARCHEARAVVDWALTDPASRDSGRALLQQWRDVQASYPGIAVRSAGQFFWRLAFKFFPSRHRSVIEQLGAKAPSLTAPVVD